LDRTGSTWSRLKAMLIQKAYVSIHQHTSAYVSRRRLKVMLLIQETTDGGGRKHLRAGARLCQHTSAYIKSVSNHLLPALSLSQKD
jgi:hypothetical protein